MRLGYHAVLFAIFALLISQSELPAYSNSLVPEGYRILTIRVDEATLRLAYVQPSRSVSVTLVRKSNNTNRQAISRVLVPNARVAAVGANSDKIHTVSLL